MIVFLDTLFGIFELGLIAVGVLLMALHFMRARPAGLVWVSVAAMVILLGHLYLEHGRWQLIPLYVVVFGFAIWLAVPGKRPYRSGGLALRIAFAVFLLIPALLLPIAIPVFRMPVPTGPHAVGSADLLVTAADGGSVPVTIRYPRPADAPLQERGLRYLFPTPGISGDVLAPYWSLADLLGNQLPGYPSLVGTHLRLVPSNSVLRGHRAEGVFPVVLAIPSPMSLPSDYLVLTEQIASLGWIVLQAPSWVSAEDLVRILERLEQGDLDSAFTGAVDTNRAVLLALGWDPGIDLGLPTLRVGAGELLSVVASGSSYGIALPDSRIPGAALTNRYLLVRPSRLLIGSSDVAPADLTVFLTRTISGLLSNGSLSAPVFGAEPAHSVLTGARTLLTDLVPDTTIQTRAGTR